MQDVTYIKRVVYPYLAEVAFQKWRWTEGLDHRLGYPRGLSARRKPLTPEARGAGPPPAAGLEVPGAT
jgi:hypothetical protein